MLNLQVYSRFRKENRSECGNLDTERQILHVFSYRQILAFNFRLLGRSIGGKKSY